MPTPDPMLSVYEAIRRHFNLMDPDDDPSEWPRPPEGSPQQPLMYPRNVRAFVEEEYEEERMVNESNRERGLNGHPITFHQPMAVTPITSALSLLSVEDSVPPPQMPPPQTPSPQTPSPQTGETSRVARKRRASFEPDGDSGDEMMEMPETKKRRKRSPKGKGKGKGKGKAVRQVAADGDDGDSHDADDEDEELAMALRESKRPTLHRSSHSSQSSCQAGPSRTRRSASSPSSSNDAPPTNFHLTENPVDSSPSPPVNAAVNGATQGSRQTSVGEPFSLPSNTPFTFESPAPTNNNNNNNSPRENSNPRLSVVLQPTVGEDEALSGGTIMQDEDQNPEGERWYIDNSNEDDTLADDGTLPPLDPNDPMVHAHRTVGEDVAPPGGSIIAAIMQDADYDPRGETWFFNSNSSSRSDTMVDDGTLPPLDPDDPLAHAHQTVGEDEAPLGGTIIRTIMQDPDYDPRGETWFF